MELSNILQTGQKVQFSQASGHEFPVPDGEVASISDDIFTVRLGNGARVRSADILYRQLTMAWEKSGMEHECPVFVEQVIGDTLHLRVQFSERREYQRIASRLPLVYEEVPDNLVDSVYEKMLAEMPSSGDLEIEVDSFWRSEDVSARIDEQFHQMTRFMDQINSKLEYLIALNEGREAPRPAVHFVELISISGAGVSFLDQKPMVANALLKLRIQLARFPLREVACIGRVVRVTAIENGRYDVGVKFERIHDNDRERVFRYISRVERQLLRERKELSTK